MPNLKTTSDPGSVHVLDVDEDQLITLAHHLAPQLAAGNCVALLGDLGAGKSTFARALIRAWLSEPDHDVPSPTFSLRQDYCAAGTTLVHFDLYRLASPEDLEELGFVEALIVAIVLVEWPERAGAILPQQRIEVRLSMAAEHNQRRLSLQGFGAAAIKTVASALSLSRQA